MYGEERYSGKCGICAICSRIDYRRGSSEGPLCKIKIKSRAPLRGAYQSQAFAVYYDTDNYRLIRNSLEKPKYKEKFRIRGYGEVNENSRIFLEIKKKYKGIVFKRRLALPADQAKAYLEEGRKPEEQNQIFREIDYFIKFYHPVPRVYLAYDRRAYYGITDLCELKIYPVSFSKYGTVYSNSIRSGEITMHAVRPQISKNVKNERNETVTGNQGKEEEAICLQVF